MPMYDYKCPKCGHIEEELVPADERDTIEIQCDSCHLRMKPQLSAPALKFRGSGFHITDYGKRGPKQ